MMKWIKKAALFMMAASMWLSMPIYAQEQPVTSPEDHLLEIKTEGPGAVEVKYGNLKEKVTSSKHLSVRLNAGEQIEMKSLPDDNAFLSSVMENDEPAFGQLIPEKWTFAMPGKDISLICTFEANQSAVQEDTSNNSDMADTETDTTIETVQPAPEQPSDPVDTEETPMPDVNPDQTEKNETVLVQASSSTGGKIQITSPVQASVSNDQYSFSAAAGSSLEARLSPDPNWMLDSVLINGKALNLNEKQKKGMSLSEKLDQDTRIEVFFAPVVSEEEKEETSSPYEEDYKEAQEIYPGNVDDLFWDNKIVASGLAQPIDARSYNGTIGNSFHTIAIVSNNNQPIKNIHVAQIFINGQDGYCINPMATFANGPKVRLNAYGILSDASIKNCSLALYYVKNSRSLTGKTYGAFSNNGSVQQYMIMQCLVYRIISSYEPGNNFGNSHLIQSGSFNWNDQVNLINDATTFAAQNVNNYQGYSASVYVTNSLNDPSQPAVDFGTPTKINYGSLKLQKSSSNTGIHQNNPLYSLNGAQFTVKNSSGANVGTLTTDANGVSNTLSNLPVGTYTITETKAPAGFAINTTAVKVEVKTNQTTTATVSDAPQISNASLILTKKNSKTKAPVANAQFLVKFYGTNSDKDPASQSQKPLRSWILKSDDKGQVVLDDAHKVSGDAFYTYNGKTVLPLGTLTVQETKPADGYIKNDKVHVINMKTTSNKQEVNLYSPFEMSNTPVSLQVIKVQNGTKIPLPNVEFTHQDPQGNSETLKTDANGSFTITPLKVGQHILREAKVPEGYTPTPGKIVFTAKSDGSVILDEGSLATIQKDVLTIANDIQDVQLEIVKENDLNEKLKDAEFSLYADQACTKLIESKSTDENGLLVFDQLKNNETVYLKETRAPAHHQLETDANGQPLVWKITPNVIPALDQYEFEVNNQKITLNDSQPDIFVSQSKGVARLHLRVSNTLIRSVLPETGGPGLDWMGPFGMGLALASAAFWLLLYKKTKLTSN